MSSTATMTQERVQAAAAAASPKSAASPAGAPRILTSFTSKAGPGRLVTPAELAVNEGIGSTTGRAWISVHGHVFDITDFSKVHPGGDSIRLAAGRDATCLVESYHPATSISRVESALATRATYIGFMEQDGATVAGGATVAQAQAAYKRANDAFFLDVRARVDKFIAEQGSHRYAYEAVGVAEAVLTALLYMYAMYAVAVHGSWAWTVMLGILTARMGFLMHMGNHCATSRSPTINRVVGWFMDIAGSNATIWGYEHQVAHHGEPNEYKKDNDCQIGNPTVRMHPDIPHTATQRWQHILVPVAMTVGLFKWYVGDVGHFFAKEVGNIRMAIDHRDWAMLSFFKVYWMIAHVVWPVYYQGWGLALAQCFVFMALGGHYLENIFIVNHIQEDLVPPPDAHWADKQVMASANWKSGSAFWNLFSGGLNHQIEHHMFPSLSHYWYAPISAIVRQCALDHGLPYQNFSSFGSAWWAMFTYLRDLGSPDFVSKKGHKGAKAVEEDNKKTA